MLQNKRLLLVGLIVPILVLIGIVAKAEYQYGHGSEVELQIHGYDPRDLLSGYYLTYSVDYGIKTCEGNYGKYNAYICLAPRQFSLEKPHNCQLYIRGACNNGRFEAGVERFYTSESEATQLEQLIRHKPLSIILSVSSDGHAQLKDLLVEGKRWHSRN